MPKMPVIAVFSNIIKICIRVLICNLIEGSIFAISKKAFSYTAFFSVSINRVMFGLEYLI